MKKTNPPFLTFSHQFETTLISDYLIDNIPFSIHIMSHNFLLEVSMRLMVQFKINKTNNWFRFKTMEEAVEAAQVIYKGKGAEIEEGLVGV